MHRNHRAWVRSQIVVEKVSRINSNTIARREKPSMPTAAVTKRLRHMTTIRGHNPSTNVSNNGNDGDNDSEEIGMNLKQLLGQIQATPRNGHTTHK